MHDAERIAFEHAAQLCREYRAENAVLKRLLVSISVALLIILVAYIRLAVLYAG